MAPNPRCTVCHLKIPLDLTKAIRCKRCGELTHFMCCRIIQVALEDCAELLAVCLDCSTSEA